MQVEPTDLDENLKWPRGLPRYGVEITTADCLSQTGFSRGKKLTLDESSASDQPTRQQP